MLPFPLASVWRPEDDGQLVCHLLLAEFDLTTGSTVKHQVPSPVPHYTDDFFAEKMLPEGAHNREMDYTMFFLNTKSPTPDELMERAAAPDMSPSDKTATSVEQSATIDMPPFLYCMNIVRTKHDASVRRGALVKALAVCAKHHFIQLVRPAMELSLDAYFRASTPEQGLDILRRLYDSLNAIDLAAIPRPTAVERSLMRRGVAGRLINEACSAYTPQSWVFTTHMTLDGVRIPISIPLHLSSDEAGERCLVQLVRAFGPDTMRIYNAVLTGKRIIFVGYNHPASDVCKFVLAAASLVSPPLIGTIRRTCPYTNLSDLSFLDMPCYIAGVTNPMFESHEEWWDLLCVLDLPQGKGRCYYPGEKAEEDKPSIMVERKVLTEDEAQRQEMDDVFITKVLSGVDARLGEDWTRSMFQEYTQTLLDYALDGPGQSSGMRVREDIRKAFKANEGRLRAMKKVPEYGNALANPWRAIPNLPVRGEILRSHVRLLEVTVEITEPEAERIFSDFSKALQSEAAVQTFLASMPEARQGLFRISSALFHSSQHVRFYACLLLQRLESFDSTRPAVFALNKYLLLAYKRVTEEMTAT